MWPLVTYFSVHVSYFTAFRNGPFYVCEILWYFGISTIIGNLLFSSDHSTMENAKPILPQTQSQIFLCVPTLICRADNVAVYFIIASFSA